jgi:hypothetical protein
MAFERRYQPLLPRREFFFRYVRWGAAAATILFGSLTIGVIGYHFLDGIPWIDSLLNASMILGGMGPVDTLKNNSAKIFASFYALYSGLLLISLAGLMLTPLVHRFLHKFHLELDKREEAKLEAAKAEKASACKSPRIDD